MNLIKISIPCTLSVVLFMIISCGKDNDNQPKQKDFSKLTGRVWRSDRYPITPNRYLQYFTGDSGLLRYRSRTDMFDTTYYKEKFTWQTKDPDSISMDFGYRISRYRISLLTDSTLILSTDSAGILYYSF